MRSDGDVLPSTKYEALGNELRAVGSVAYVSSNSSSADTDATVHRFHFSQVIATGGFTISATLATVKVGALNEYSFKVS